jgi:hypothetical protein
LRTQDYWEFKLIRNGVKPPESTEGMVYAADEGEIVAGLLIPAKQ